MLAKTTLAVAAAASAAALIAGHPSSPALPLPRQELPAPFHGQHTGVAIADLNGDGAPDLLFAAGRHWVDQPFALLNLGPDLRDDDDAATGTGTGTGTGGGGGGRFRGVRFSDALPLGPPGGYYQVDALAAKASGGGGGAGDDDDARVTSTVLLVGGTCHVEKPSDFGSCVKASLDREVFDFRDAPGLTRCPPFKTLPAIPGLEHVRNSAGGRRGAGGVLRGPSRRRVQPDVEPGVVAPPPARGPERRLRTLPLCGGRTP